MKILAMLVAMLTTCQVFAQSVTDATEGTQVFTPAQTGLKVHPKVKEKAAQFSHLRKAENVNQPQLKEEKKTVEVVDRMSTLQTAPLNKVVKEEKLDFLFFDTVDPAKDDQ